MDPATIALIIEGITAAVKAAPQIEEVVIEAKNFIATLFKHGLIDQATQARLFAHVDAICAAAINGDELPEWTVEADPS